MYDVMKGTEVFGVLRRIYGCERYWNGKSGIYKKRIKVKISVWLGMGGNVIA